MNIKTILDAAGGVFYNYGGSLTMPPCDEDVNWILMAKFLPLKKNEFWQFYSLATQYGWGNNRAIVNDNSWPILLGKIKSDEQSVAKNSAYLLSPTLSQLKSQNRMVHLVVFVGRNG